MKERWSDLTDHSVGLTHTPFQLGDLALRTGRWGRSIWLQPSIFFGKIISLPDIYNPGKKLRTWKLASFFGVRGIERT